MISVQKVYYSAVLGWSLAILFFTLSPEAPGSVPLIDLPHFDKVGHFGLFFILAVLLYLALKPFSKVFRVIFYLSYCAALGAATEYLQTRIPERNGDWLDFMADIAGSVVGFLIISYINFRYRGAN
ncbi:MAG: VanZ family protein [Cyclobacteriaceae bacterium]